MTYLNFLGRWRVWRVWRNARCPLRRVLSGRLRLEELETRTVPTTVATPLSLDFGTTTSAVAPGYVGVPLVAYTSARGYGWNSLSGMSASDRGTSNPLTSDFHRGTDSTFMVDLANGNYQVTITTGDSLYNHDDLNVYAEGQLMLSGLSTKAGQFLQRTISVQVTDGQLDLRFVDAGGASPYFAINGLNIVLVSGIFVANAGPNLSGSEGVPVTFQGSVADTNTSLSYLWDFGDGTTASGTLTPTHTYLDGNSYTATLTVTDPRGPWTSSATTVVQVAHVPPLVTILGAPSQAQEGTTLRLESSVTEVNPVDQAAGFTYAWSVTKNGVFFAGGNTAAFEFTPDDSGSYVATLTVTDVEGAQSSVTSSSISVFSVPPTVSMGGPYAGYAQSPIAFGATVVDPSPADTAAGFTFAWDFGDGSTSSQKAPTHTYAAAGVYAVILVVTDDDGDSVSVNTSVSVSQALTPTSGVYSLAIPDGAIDPRVLTNPSVSGVAVRASWNLTETASGTYNWSYLDRVIAQVTAAGKQFSLAISAGVKTPAWVYAAGSQAFTFVQNGITQTIPVPWDPVFLGAWEQFVQALGARYGSNPLLTNVKITGINTTTDETMLPKTPTDVSNWQALGYTRLEVENAWQAIADTFATAFPIKGLVLLTVPSGFPAIDNNGNIISSMLKAGDSVLPGDLISGGISRYGAQFIVQNNGLSDTWISPQVTAVAGQVNTGYQMLWNVSNDPTYRMTGGQTPYDPATVLQVAVNKALAAGAHYLEIYQIDILNANLADVLASAESSLTGSVPLGSITGLPQSGHVPEATPVTLGSLATDANGNPLTPGVLYNWTVTRNGMAYASGNAATFTFTPDDSGTYVISLIVTDSAGHHSLGTSQTLIVDDVAPTVSVGGPNQAAAGSLLPFLPLVSDPSLLAAGAGFTYLWNFGDGNTSNAAQPGHVYVSPGTYVVTLTVTDKDGLSNLVTTLVTIV